jgi:hypothetical protein
MTLWDAALAWFHDINKQMADKEYPLTWDDMTDAEHVLYKKVEHAVRRQRKRT